MQSSTITEARAPSQTKKLRLCTLGMLSACGFYSQRMGWAHGPNLDERLEGPPVDPNASFSIQLAAAVYGMALIPETYGFFQRSRIWLQNGPEGVTPAAGVATASFTDPETGFVYMAASGNERYAGAQMIQQAQALLLWPRDGRGFLLQASRLLSVLLGSTHVGRRRSPGGRSSPGGFDPSVGLLAPVIDDTGGFAAGWDTTEGSVPMFLARSPMC